MIKHLVLWVLLACLSLSPVHAQLLHHVQGELLVQFNPHVSARQWAKHWRYFEGRPTKMEVKKVVSKPLRIYAITFDFATIHEDRLLRAVRQHGEVAQAQFNHFVHTRSTIPDDPGFASQWQYLNTGQSGGTPGADIDMDLAWDITTGGVTVDGDTIVVCALDDGIDPNHQDFQDNLWHNYAEIPNNGIDDDGNGYVDDYRGWSTVTGNDNINGGGHGTPVAGIMGAKGNNALGVSGISWNVKVMIVKNNFNTDEAAVLEAYTYPLVQRMRYNASNGQEGAFVVSTNASWGIDFGDPEDSPLWCAFYDTLGIHGILSCGATINGNVDVDIEGDLPTACPSDYFISVTNMNHNDVKVTGAGYGATTIDLGAFGANTWTTALGNTYAPFGGTSGATPHVTGTVGLLYAAPCPSFIAIAKSDPGAAVLLAKQYILDGTDPNESLEGITVTGGRLNVFRSLSLLMESCGGCPPASSIEASAITDSQATIQWIQTDSIVAVDLLWRLQGDTIWNTISAVASPFVLNGLLACTDYEVQLTSYCNNDTTSSNIQTFKTDGCCTLPPNFTLGAISETSIELSWGSLLAATNFIVKLKKEGSNTAVSFNISNITTALVIQDLLPCTRYELQIQTVCDTVFTELSPIYTFRTRGCGACTDLDYCEVNNLNASEEWIGHVQFESIDNMSGSNDGYANNTEFSAPQLELGNSYGITLAPAYIAFAYQEYFKVWIDYNQNGEFDTDELVFDPGASTNIPIMGTIIVPADAPVGLTRMRVVMNFLNVDGPCNFFDGTFGEVEDYCVEILPSTYCAIPENIDTIAVTYSEAELGWDEVAPAISYIVRYRPLNATEWITLGALSPGINLPGLDPCSQYEAEISTVCGFNQSDYSETYTFNTDCATATHQPGSEDFTWRLMPNPFHDRLRIEIQATGQQEYFQLELINGIGQVLDQQSLLAFAPGKYEAIFDRPDLLAGIYFIRVRSQDGRTSVRKVLKW